MSNTNSMLQLISHNVQPAAIDYNYAAVKAYVEKKANNILTIKATVNAVNGTISAPFNEDEFIRMLDHYELQEIVNNINNRAEQVREAERRAKEAAELRAKKDAQRKEQEDARRVMQMTKAAQSIQNIGIKDSCVNQTASFGQNISAPNIPVPSFVGMPDPQKQVWLLSLNIRTSAEKLQLLNAFLKDNDIEYKKVNLIKE